MQRHQIHVLLSHERWPDARRFGYGERQEGEVFVYTAEAPAE
ncbi:MAG: hypothetical protein ACOCZ8_02960 [Bacteroidota bacterium]